jgi:hypothetical protein
MNRVFDTGVFVSSETLSDLADNKDSIFVRQFSSECSQWIAVKRESAFFDFLNNTTKTVDDGRKPFFVHVSVQDEADVQNLATGWKLKGFKNCNASLVLFYDKQDMVSYAFGVFFSSQKKKVVFDLPAPEPVSREKKSSRQKSEKRQKRVVERVEKDQFVVLPARKEYLTRGKRARIGNESRIARDDEYEYFAPVRHMRV